MQKRQVSWLRYGRPLSKTQCTTAIRNAEHQKAPPKHQHGRQKHVYYVEDEPQINDYDFSDKSDAIAFDVLDHETDKTQAFTLVKVKIQPEEKRKKLKLKIDAEAQGNTLPLRMFKKMFPCNVDNRGEPVSVHLPNTKLTAYIGTAIHHGSIKIICKDKRGQWFDLEFYIMDTPGPAAIGLPGSRTLGLVTLHCAIQNTNAAPDGTRRQR